MAESYKGRLELNWTNKNLRLLAHDDNAYEWVSPTDYRVAEVRLLKDVATIGQARPTVERAANNLLIHGDALNALTALTSLPEFAGEYLGKVRLAYIDPPFNTQQTFQHYDDALEHSVWLTMMRDRLLQIQDLLSPSGSVWVHCDDSEGHRLRSVLDEVFGPENFVATFIWQKVDSPNDNKVAVTPDHDYIVCYAKSMVNLHFSQMPDASILDAYGPPGPDGRRFRDRLLKKNGKNSLRTDRPTMFFPVTDPDGNDVYPVHDDGREACWSMGEVGYKRVVSEGRVVWKKRPSPGGDHWVPYVREWASDNPTRPWPTIWTDCQTTRQAKAHLRQLFPGLTPFETPKPEPLLQKILNIGTDPGDIVLDCFVGSGTTAAVAHKMGRRWVAVERSRDTLDNFTIPRLTKVVTGEDLGGISSRKVSVGEGLPEGIRPGEATTAAKVLGALAEDGYNGLQVLSKHLRSLDKTRVETVWPGGGSFHVLEVATSMFTSIDGIVVLAEWATNGALAEAVTAQLGFGFFRDPPFSGKKGKTRLAVIDGLVTSGAVRLLVAALGEDEKLHVCGTAIEPEARVALKTLRPGSAVRRIPSSILSSYRSNLTLWDMPKEDVSNVAISE